MKKIVIISILIVALTACKKAKFVNNILPNPKHLESNNKTMTLKENVFLVFSERNTETEKIANYLIDLFNPLKVRVNEAKQSGGTNIFLTLENQLKEEEYLLVIDNKNITISGGSYKAVFWGIQTLRQLLPIELEKNEMPRNFKLPQINIYDQPNFSYRGMHLDVCRHFFGVEDVKTYIDILILHKINTFHFHLTDDQGWRLDIKSFPKLAEIASQRDMTMIKKEWGMFDSIPYIGFYTAENIKEIVEYAEERFVTVIPEIEMPGHSLAALTAYPNLGCIGKNYNVGTYWGVFDDVFCAGNDSVFLFLEKVIDEVCELFPNSPYIHVGGDECPKTRWKECPKCRERIKNEKLKDENELQSYFVRRMEEYINSKGKQIIGWDEILEGCVAPNATIMSWRGENGTIEAAKQKHNVILTPNSICYFDHYQSEDQGNEPYTIGGFSNCEKILNWKPIPDTLTTKESSFIIGIQANMWSEYMPDFKKIEYMVLPRMAALSEIAWNNTNKISYPEFNKRIKILMQRYDALKYDYAIHELSKFN